MARRAPIVLVHGLLGFDRVKIGPFTVARYFPAIEERLHAEGYRVGTPSLSKTRGISERAQELRAYLLQHFPNERVHIIAHSMGGLDARYMISRLGMAEGVRSLTTLGTPHHGSTFADWSLRRLARVAMPVAKFLGIPTQAFYDLTTESCRRFNEEIRDEPSVRYFSIAGRCPPECVAPLWKPSAIVVGRAEGDNDSMVSVASAQYGEVLDIWNADHMNLVNRINKRNPTARGTPNDYAALVERITQLSGS